MNNHRGFTLVEFMIVVVIIGILAAIAIPNFLSMQDRAKEFGVRENMRTIQRAFDDFGFLANGYPTSSEDVTPSGKTVVDLMPGGKWPTNPFTGAATSFSWGMEAATVRGACAAITATESNYVIRGRGNDTSTYLPPVFAGER